jgi:hypothetical protein
MSCGCSLQPLEGGCRLAIPIRGTVEGSMKIDFVSDVSCPWCAVGLKSLETALARLGPEIGADLHFQPFELNPQMGPEGQDIAEHIAEKYGSSAVDIGRSQEVLKARGDALGFPFDFKRRSRIYNTSTRIGCCTGRKARASSTRSRTRCSALTSLKARIRAIAMCSRAWPRV